MPNEIEWKITRTLSVKVTGAEETLVMISPLNSGVNVPEKNTLLERDKLGKTTFAVKRMCPPILIRGTDDGEE